MINILLTGASGYIGHVLTPVLAKLGCQVTGVDANFFAEPLLYPATQTPFQFRQADIRQLTADDLAGFDAIVHLGELSNDPLSELSPRLTREINADGTCRLATLAKEAGVKRFVYASSCSVYGIATEGVVTEASPLNPQTVYAECKQQAEGHLLGLADEDFTVTILRNATVFGPSPAMRFDLVVNNLVGVAVTTGVIAMTSDGSPWRPLVHVDDVCHVIGGVLHAPTNKVNREILNVVGREGNYQIRTIAEGVKKAMSELAISFGPPSGDTRSYRVSGQRLTEVLDGFTCQKTLDDGIQDLLTVYQRIGLTKATFTNRPFTRLKQLRHLLETNQVSEELYWQKSVAPSGAPALSASR